MKLQHMLCGILAGALLTGACTTVAVQANAVSATLASTQSTSSLAVRRYTTSLASVGTSDYRSWKQWDSRWAYTTFPDGSTLKSSGCLVTSLAIAAVHSGVKPNNTSQFNPGTFLKELARKSGIAGSSLNWMGVPYVLNEFSLVGSHFYNPSAGTIANHLKQGRQVVVNVRGGQHWVLVEKVMGNTLYVMDPGYYVSSYPVSAVGQYAVYAVRKTPVSSVKLNKSSLTLTKGTNHTLSATVAPSNAVDKELVWKSSNSKVATVDTKGKITAVGAGTATITASSRNGKKSSCTVTVKLPETLQLYATTQALSTYQTAGGKATGTLGKGNNLYVIQEGLEKKNGVSYRKCKRNNAYFYLLESDVKSLQRLPEKITLKATTLTLTQKQTKSLGATVSPSAAKNKTVTYTSSNKAVATVNEKGVITAAKPGTTTITAKTHNGKTATCKVTVAKPKSYTAYKTTSNVKYRKTAGGTPAGTLKAGTTVQVVNGSSKKQGGLSWYQVKVGNGHYYIAAKYVKKVSKTVTPTKVTLNRTTATLVQKKTMTLKATVSPTSAKNKKVTYSSSNKTVATVNAKGVVTAVKPGTATITVKTQNGKKATCKVTVKAPETYTKYVTTNAVKYRTSPSTSGKVKGTLKKGTTVQVVNGYSKKANGYTWYKVKHNNSYYYVASSHLKKATTSAKKETLVKYKTTASVNYRKSVGGAVAGTLKKGATVQLVNGYSKKQGGYTWYKMKLNNQYYYVVKNYLKKA